MPADIPIEDQLEIVRKLVRQTLQGKVIWAESGERGTYRSSRPSAVAVLDRMGSGAGARVRLRFSPPGTSDFETVIQQQLSASEPFLEEQELAGQLELLYRLVDDKSPRHQNLGQRFIDDE